jgi:hypothetical protein
LRHWDRNPTLALRNDVCFKPVSLVAKEQRKTRGPSRLIERFGRVVEYGGGKFDAPAIAHLL